MVNKREILCPYCCNRFSATDVHFRLVEPENGNENNETASSTEDTSFDFDDFENSFGSNRGSKNKGNKDNNNGKVLDQKLYDHYISRNHDPDNAKSAAMNYGFIEFNPMKPNGLEYDREALHRYGYVNSVRYKGKELNTRLCPHCHRDIIPSAGKYDMYMFSVIGDTAVGKSIYLAVLEVMIEKGSFGASMMFMGTKEEKKHYLSVKQDVIIDRVGVEATIDRVPPLTFQLTYDKPDTLSGMTRESILVTFCDIPGEKCRDSEELKVYGDHLKASDGLLFLVDPSRFARVKNSIHEDVDLDNSVQIEVISAINQYLVSGSYDTHCSIPAAVMITKSDLLKELPYFRNSSKKMELLNAANWRTVHDGFVDDVEIERINAGIYEFLDEMGESDFPNKMRDLFQTHKFFINSALGHSLKKEEDGDDANEMYRQGNIAPYRVTEAFYWILAENGLLPRKRVEKYKNSKTGEEKTISVYFYKNESQAQVRQKLDRLKEAQGIKDSFFTGKWTRI